MQLPAFDYTRMHWDAWQAFHIDYDSVFIQFDTGEFVVRHHDWRPNERKVHYDLHLQVVATADRDCPRLYAPGHDRPIPRAHLERDGQQVLLLDLDHGRAVSLDGVLRDAVPGRFVCGSLAAYYAGAVAMPLGGGPITRRWPHPLTHDLRRHAAAVTDACKVWLGMHDDDARRELTREHRYVKAPVWAFLGVPFAELSEATRTAVAVRGFGMIAEEKHPWLTFKT
jgi:hypothetical protein